MLIAGRGRAWVARLNASADGELFRIDLGRDQIDAVNAVVENADGTIYAAGSMRTRGVEVGFWAQLDAEGKQTRFEQLPSAAYAIAIDANGSVYVAGDGFVMRVDGWRIAPPGPVRALALDGAGTLYAAGSKPAEIGAGSDAYIAQLNATHDHWQWTLPIGGTGAGDEARALAIGADGAVYAAGVTDSVDFPVKLAYQSRFNGPRDAFLVKVDPNGNGLVWSTYLGGRGADSAAALAFDTAGNLIVAGSTDSPDFPGGDRWNGAQDGFFARFDTTGHFQEGAYIGTSGLEEINAIAVDHTGAAYAAGSTNLGLEEVLLAAIPMAASRRVGITPSSVTLAVSPTPVSVFGSPVTLTATVSPSSATGTVTYYDGVGVIGSGAVSAGKAILQTVLLPAGARPLSAFYSGDAVYSTSKSTAVTLSVNAVPSLVMGHSTGIPISAGADPRTVATGDFNGDGKADLAIANYYSDSVVVLLGDGAGGFTPAPGISFAAGTRPFFIRAADVNGDGKQDLLMGSTNGNGSKMTVLLGNGNGGFSTANGSPFTVAGGMNSFTVGDFNNDGKVDIVTASISSTVSVMLGDGSGGFTATSPISIGSNATFAVAVSDVNGDGNADIAVTNSANNTVAILLGNGAGGFQLAAGSPFATGGTQPRSIAIGDLNGDGKPDIVTGNASGNVSVLLGNGSGGFAPASGSPIAVGSSTSDIAIGDINGDGKMDLVVAVGLTTISVLLGNGAAGFTPMTGSPYTVEQSPSSIVLADFNGDGRTDIVTVISSSSPKSLSILFGTGPALGIVLSAAPAPTSTLGQLVTLTTAVPASIATGKVTFYDGTTVLGTSPVSAETAVLTTTALPSGSRSLRAYYSGDSNFFAATSPTITQTVTVLPSGVFKGSALSTGAGSQPYGVAAGDFNRDGRQDLAVVHSGSNAVSIWLSNGGGGFTQSAGSPFPVGTTPVAIAVGDVNGDGILDLAVANLGSSTITLLLGNAAGGFTAATGGLIVTGSAPRSIAMGDFNGDGNLDIVTANSGSNNITVLLGNGSGGFAPALGSPFAAGSAPWSIVTGDFNGDGMADLAVANNGSNNVTILLGTGGGAFTAASGSPFAAGANPWA